MTIKSVERGCSMKVVNNRVIDFRNDEDSLGVRSARLVCEVPESDREHEHDARGLVVALLLCLACWAALAYFLLT